LTAEANNEKAKGNSVIPYRVAISGIDLFDPSPVTLIAVRTACRITHVANLW
jgi:hypothetical protein